VVIPAAGGEVIGDSPERRVEILCDDDALHATWSRFEPGREGADLHVHRRHSDLFYVLAGELTVRLGVADERVTVPAGTVARVPPGVVHGFLNGGDDELRYLNFHAPGQGFADYLRALRDGRTLVYDQDPPPADGGRPVTEAVIGGAEPLVEEPGLHVVRHADIEAIAISEVTLEPGHRFAAAHPRLEALYVFEGELAVAVAGRERQLPAGTWIQLPPGVEAECASAGSGPVRFLDVRAPR
jgi:quercetin dioxygenase-like cupin family protein